MKTHELKLSIEFCDDVYNGIKTFEIRMNDRGYQTGDLIRFKPYYDGYPTYEQLIHPHPITDKTYRIKYILNGWGLKNGFVALGIEEVELDKIETIKENHI